MHHAFEKTALPIINNCQARDLAGENFADTLIGRTASLDGTDAEVADSMKVRGVYIAVGDIVFCGDCAGLILACAIEHGRFFAIVEGMTLVRQFTENSVVLRKSGARAVWDAASLYPAEAWYLIENQDWAVLRLI